MSAASVTAAGSVLAPPAAALRLMSDERLARWAAKGSEAAFAVIFERHHQALHRYCHSIVGNGHDAADALQSTMLKALRALPGESRAITLKPWLYRIAHNESISLLRARRSDSDIDAAWEVGDHAADTIFESRERLRDLTADLRELTEQQRGALLMRELAGLAFTDVAAALQIKETAARQSVYEARRALQDLEAGRAMDCDAVRRTLSDGGRRTLRGLKMRGHLRACAGCRDFETAMAQRPAQLAALTPPLPLAAAASILQGLLGGGGGGHGGGGLLAGLSTGGAKGIAGASLTAKIATVAAVGSTIVGGAAVTVPALDATPDRAATSPAAPADGSRVLISHTATLQREAARARAAKASKARAASADQAVAGRIPGGTRPGASPTATNATSSPAKSAAAKAAAARQTAKAQAARRGSQRAPTTTAGAGTTRKPAQRPTPTSSANKPVSTPTTLPVPPTSTAPVSAAPAPPVTPPPPVTIPTAPPAPPAGGAALSPR